MKKYLDIYIVGVGGQGVLTIADLITQTACKKDMPVNFYPTKGMAQRGGFVKAQLRIGRTVFAPSIPEMSADILVSMEQSEALKAIRYGKEGADYVLYDFRWEPTAVMLGKGSYPELVVVEEAARKSGIKIHHLDCNKLPEYEGTPVRDNLYVMGAIAALESFREFFTPEEILETITEKWPKVKEANIAAFCAGIKA